MPLVLEHPRARPASAHQRLLTLRQASEETGIPIRSLHDLIEKRVLPVVRFPGSRLQRIERADLEGAIQAAKR
jgi:excisionase family DNA binding protein